MDKSDHCWTFSFCFVSLIWPHFSLDVLISVDVRRWSNTLGALVHHHSWRLASPWGIASNKVSIVSYIYFLSLNTNIHSNFFFTFRVFSPNPNGWDGGQRLFHTALSRFNPSTTKSRWAQRRRLSRGLRKKFTPSLPDPTLRFIRPNSKRRRCLLWLLPPLEPSSSRPRFLG